MAHSIIVVAGQSLTLNDFDLLALMSLSLRDDSKMNVSLRADWVRAMDAYGPGLLNAAFEGEADRKRDIVETMDRLIERCVDLRYVDVGGPLPVGIAFNKEIPTTTITSVARSLRTLLQATS